MDQLVLFAKYPEPGRVKSRLAAAIGPDRAVALYKVMVETVVARTAPRNGVDYERVLYCDPPERTVDFQTWLPQIPRQRPQQGQDLGERMRHAFAECFAVHAQRVCLIGTDCLEIDAVAVGNAFIQVDRHDLVIGPATDGGYYLLGMNRPIPELFEGIAWSTDHVLAQTLAKAEVLRLRVATLRLQHDVDRVKDLENGTAAALWKRVTTGVAGDRTRPR